MALSLSPATLHCSGEVGTGFFEGEDARMSVACFRFALGDRGEFTAVCEGGEPSASVVDSCLLCLSLLLWNEDDDVDRCGWESDIKEVTLVNVADSFNLTTRENNVFPGFSSFSLRACRTQHYSRVEDGRILYVQRVYFQRLPPTVLTHSNGIGSNGTPHGSRRTGSPPPSRPPWSCQIRSASSSAALCAFLPCIVLFVTPPVLSQILYDSDHGSRIIRGRRVPEETA